MVPQIFEFGSSPFTVISYRNEPAFLARELGDALGYGDEGGKLVDMITREWADEVPSGSHVVRLEGEDLALLKNRLPRDFRGSRSRHLMLLTERGLYRVLMLAGGKKATAFRDWLDGEVLPALMKSGRYAIRGAPSAGPAAEWLRALPDELRALSGADLAELAEAESGGFVLPRLRSALLNGPAPLPRKSRGSGERVTGDFPVARVEAEVVASWQPEKPVYSHPPPSWLEHDVYRSLPGSASKVYLMLFAIIPEEGLPMSRVDLAARFGYAKHRITTILKELEAQKLLIIGPSTGRGPCTYWIRPIPEGIIRSGWVKRSNLRLVSQNE